jgi:hypothetical protein
MGSDYLLCFQSKKCLPRGAIGSEGLPAQFRRVYRELGWQIKGQVREPRLRSHARGNFVQSKVENNAGRDLRSQGVRQLSRILNEK